MSRIDLSELEWGFIAPILPNKVRGVPCVERDILCPENRLPLARLTRAIWALYDCL